MIEASIKIERCQPFIGAELSGVDLTRPISREDAAAIRAALLKYQVIVMRDQPMTHADHRALAMVFAEVPEAPFTLQPAMQHAVPDFPEIFGVYADANQKTPADIWHTDESWRVRPPTVSILRSRILPTLGGDTIFSSCVAVYEGLPEEVKAKIRDLKALHGQIYPFERIKGSGFLDPSKTSQFVEAPPYPQPVVRIHPETGLPVMFINEGWTGPIVGMENEEGEALRQYLFDQVKKPDYQMRVRWTPNTVVIWDNRSVQHYATADYKEVRHMERITVAGKDAPIGFAEFESQSAAA